MRKLITAVVAAAATALSAGAANAASILFPVGGTGGAAYSLNGGAPVTLSVGGTTPSFTRLGDYLQQTVAGGGLPYVRQASGSLLLLSNLKSATSLDVLINGTKVGSIAVPACVGCSSFTPQTYAYTFNFGSVLADTGGNYVVRLQLASAVPTGDGAIRLAARQGTLSLAAVPEPATWATMILGFGMAGYALRRRRSLAAA